MSPRRKSRLERLLSFNQHQKRFGAGRHVKDDPDLAAMKAQIIQRGPPILTRGSSKQLDQHLDDLRREFSGQPELSWHHAKLIVLIRREVRTAETYARFRMLWDSECVFLCDNLNLRWLVAAADTFAEHECDPEIRAVAMMTSLLMNTVKMQESERHLCGTAAATPDPARVDHVRTDLVPLFQGMSCFTVGTDDTLRNMRWRLERFFKVMPTGAILKTAWDRCQSEDTVFARMRAMHIRKRTSWWDG